MLNRLPVFRTDAPAWLSSRLTSPTALGWYIFAFTSPLIGGLIGRVIKERPWLVDFDALACAGVNMTRDLSPYAIKPFCEGMKATPYVYAPQIAGVFGHMIEALSYDLLRLSYVLALAIALGFIGWVGMVKAMPHAPNALRIPVYAILTGGSIASGNIGILLHAIILLCALQLDKHRWPFILAVIFGAFFKPTLMTYFIVLLYQDRPMKSRLATGFAAGIAGILAYLALIKSAGPLSDEWRASLDQIVMTEQPGIGFFSWMPWIGLEPSSTPSLILAALFMVTVAALGFAMAHWGKITAFERIMLGLGVAQLLNPRLMDYDILYIAPAVVLMATMSRHLGLRQYQAVTWGLLIMCASILLINNWDANALPIIPMSGLGITLLMLWVGSQIVWLNREKLIAPFTGLKKPRLQSGLEPL
ncbi:hypothetical protein Q1W73_14340 [Asticcacaulis sp. ZE23SCel15]|uniref:hypothetical protein n=1 Tax=Asticcacaulis sp. ZE23SCel15 TaxID=3059027 RepID=UPI00265FECE8|nr:hypothetical protein [Asticcacaulis sp. ZE23SCel15]WKL56834.1 hypothetical protein Q1W73_14340 [Asticcacaulis sp. ZE23SCel15]